MAATLVVNWLSQFFQSRRHFSIQAFDRSPQSKALRGFVLYPTLSNNDEPRQTLFFLFRYLLLYRQVRHILFLWHDGIISQTVDFRWVL